VEADDITHHKDRHAMNFTRVFPAQLNSSIPAAASCRTGTSRAGVH
jgi:hypothetical protein